LGITKKKYRKKMNINANAGFKSSVGLTGVVLGGALLEPVEAGGPGLARRPEQGGQAGVHLHILKEDKDILMVTIKKHKSIERG
jgi:hypothetical protein